MLYDELPISKDDARFLELHSGQPNDPLTCDLFVRPIDCYKLKWGDVDLPQSHKDRRIRGYRALSYAWGDPTAVCWIKCNRHEVKIGRSLYSALQHLRSSDVSQIMWADALCIHQADTSERNVQIANIGEIYEHADSIIVWLGQGSTQCSIAIDFLKLASILPSMSWDERKEGNDLHTDAMEHSDSERVRHIASLFDNTSLLKNVQRCIDDLFRRPWFRRVWIRQEIAKALSVEIACGGDRISWTALVENIECTAAILASENIKIDRECVHRALHGLEIGWARNSNTWNYSQLLDLLNNGREANASDPHDKVYALMGMASDAFVNTLEADYEKPVAEVFENVAKFLINRDGLLDVIYAAEAQETVTDQSGSRSPSWIPDWAVPSDASDILLGRRGGVR